MPGAGWVKFVLLTHNELSDLAKFYKDNQREFELQALLKMMKPCYPDLTEKDLRDAPWDPLAPSTKAGSLFLRTLAP